MRGFQAIAKPAMDPGDVRFVVGFRAALPALILAACALAPFFNKPHTLDDAVFLRVGEQFLREPLNPFGFDLIWNGNARVARASDLVPGGPLTGLVLAPTAAAGGREWVARLTQFVILSAGLVWTALLGLRLGLTYTQARWVSLLLAASPVVLGVAGTSMPDITAMTLGVIGAERWVAASGGGSWVSAGTASAFLGLAVLSRINFVLLPLLLPLFAWDKRRGPFIILGAWLLAGSGLLATSDPGSAGPWVLSGIGVNVWGSRGPLHLAILGFHLIAAFPLAWVWYSLRGRPGWIPSAIVVPCFAAIGLLDLLDLAHPMVLLGSLGVLFVIELVREALRERDALSLGAVAWILLVVPVLVYIHFPSKYLIACAPALCIALVRRLSDRRGFAFACGAYIAGGTLLGVLILRADSRFAGADRQVAETEIRAAVERGERVWYYGQWAFHWYAEKEGALPLSTESPTAPGDLVVRSLNDRSRLPDLRCPLSLERRIADSTPGGRIYSRPALAGFFSPRVGPLPWSWGSDVFAEYELWRVVDNPAAPGCGATALMHTGGQRR